MHRKCTLVQKGSEGVEVGLGLVSNIQRYSIQDGPGIRTTVFLKGCPLRCKWCSNPECLNPYAEIMIEGEACAKCETCVDICPLQCVVFDEEKEKPRIDRATCNLCMECVEACKKGALKVVGEYMRVEEVREEILKDELFYRNSSGGVTLSGGEPLYQKDFTLQLLKECKKAYLHTALDTSGYADWDVWKEVLKYTDLVLFDIKHMDSERHKEGTGVENEMIIENAARVAKVVRMWIRIPVIPGYNDDEENIRRVAEFASRIGAEKVSLLGYHELGRVKYECLDKLYFLRNVHSIVERDLDKLKRLIESYDNGLKVTIGY